jgi:uncharacterized protein
MSVKLKNIVQDINASFMEGDTEKFLSLCDENVEWEILGEKAARGKAAIREFMSSVADCAPPQFSVRDIVAEGDVVICHGDMKMTHHTADDQDYAYCDVYHFAGDRVTSLRSYIVQAKKENN